MSNAPDLTDIYTDPERYDLICASFGGEEFFRAAARRLGGPVLELDVGTGRILGGIARGGVKCVGVDLSPEMVRFAAVRHPSAKFLQGDMRGFAIPERFRLIFVANNTMQHLRHDHDWRDALICMRDHLGPGGRILLSLVNPRAEILRDIAAPREVLRYDDPQGRGEIVVTKTFAFEPATRIGVSTWVHRQESGAVFLTHAWRLFFPDATEVERRVASAGLKVVERWGDHAEAAFDPMKSDLQVVELAVC
jgi:SAM-dependent methyltransferase